jgi:hypothetical protein
MKRPNARYCSAKCRQRGHRGDESARAAKNGSPRADARVANPIVIEKEQDPSPDPEGALSLGAAARISGRVGQDPEDRDRDGQAASVATRRGIRDRSRRFGAVSPGAAHGGEIRGRAEVRHLRRSGRHEAKGRDLLLGDVPEKRAAATKASGGATRAGAMMDWTEYVRPRMRGEGDPGHGNGVHQAAAAPPGQTEESSASLGREAQPGSTGALGS